jgi:cytidylate kinase
MGARRTRDRLIIAIDGPVGAGKSTAARLLAARLGYRYIDSGAMYRAVAWKALQTGLNLEDAERLGRLATETSIRFKGSGDRLLVFVDGQEVSRRLRERAVEQASSQVSVLAAVRRAMVTRQRRMAARGGVVMDGRDIGTVVFPRADVKFYLEASLQERAKRRFLQARSAGATTRRETFVRDVAMRDRRDMEREISPLRKAEDAILIDTTHLDPEQVVDAMAATIRRRLARSAQSS